MKLSSCPVAKVWSMIVFADIIIAVVKANCDHHILDTRVFPGSFSPLPQPIGENQDYVYNSLKIQLENTSQENNIMDFVYRLLRSQNIL